MKVLGLIAACLLGGMLLGNGVVMLISPKAWFRLPRWLGAHGTLTREKYSSGPASIEVRILGAAIAGIVGWVVYDLLFR